MSEIGYCFCFPDRDIAAQIEHAFHTVFAAKALRGEWFDITPIEALEAMCANIRAYLAHEAMADDAAVLKFIGVDAVDSFFSEREERRELANEWLQ